MRGDRAGPGTPEEWLARANGDLALARAPLPEGGFYEDLCFHAQQAAEKALKAVYLARGWRFRYVHALEELITGLRSQGLEVPDEVANAVGLSDYAFETRYPGVAERVTEEECTRAAALAREVVVWASGIVERRAS